jgi:Flp pilus assembly pilin Flp
MLTKGYVKAREKALRFSKGQSMTEYALILAAIAVVVFVGYKALGTQINTLLGNVTADL